LYFDRQRRHSSAFRARIEASKKKVAKIEDEEKQQKKRQGEKDTQRAIAIASSARKIPESQSDAEQIMMDHLSQGDGAQKRGDVVSAAAYYFLAIEVHPDQEQIITGLMQHVPVEIAQIIGGMMQKVSPKPIISLYPNLE